MRVLFFTDEDCEVCERVLTGLEQSGILKDHDVLFIQALDDDTQDLCDEHEVDLLPHIKIYNNELIYERCGWFSPDDIKKYLK